MVGLLLLGCLVVLGWLLADHLRRAQAEAWREWRAQHPAGEVRSHPFHAPQAWRIDDEGDRHPL